MAEVPIPGPQGETLETGPQIETIVQNDLSGPFSAAKDGSQWRLLVNRNYFLSQGFMPDEIDGAIGIEEERLRSQVSVTTPGELDGLKHWQKSGAEVPETAAFKTLFERISALRSLERRDPKKAEQAKQYLKKISSRTPTNTHSDQLLHGILQGALGEEVVVTDDRVSNVLTNLGKQELIDGREVSSLDALSSSNLSYNAKTAWFENRVMPRLEFLIDQDRNNKQEPPTQEPDQQDVSDDQPEGQQQAEPAESPPPTPPETKDEFEQHRGKEGKGEAEPLFIIDPFHPGYFETESYGIIDEATGKLRKFDFQKTRQPLTTERDHGEALCTVKGSSGTNLFSVPRSLDMTPDQESLSQLQAAGIEVLEDDEGHVTLRSTINQPYEINLARTFKQTADSGSFQQDTETAEVALPTDILGKIGEINGLSADSIDKAILWQEFIRSYFTYPQDEQVESMYQQVDAAPGSRLTAMTNGKLVDCHFAREFFIAGLKRLNLSDLEWRAANGHYLTAKQQDGTGHLHSGTGHAWVRARLRTAEEWLIFDATPDGDPVHDGEGTSQQFEDSPSLISESDMQKLAEDVSSGSEKPKDLPPEEDYLMEFAKEAGVETAEAQAILNTLKQVDEMKDRNGRNILKRVKEQFDRIIHEYTQQRVENVGSVEMSRGRGLDDPVEAFLDIQMGSLDPVGFSRQTVREEKEQLYGGFDAELVVDGSGSMNEPLGGMLKYVLQQKMSYVFHRGVHYFAAEAQKRKLRLVTPLGVRSSQYMFRGNKIEEIKPLSTEFTPAQMATLWKRSGANIGGGTPAHLGLKAILDNIPADEVELLKQKKLLKFVALISDGGYDNPQSVAQLKKQLEAMNVVVAEFPITTAQSLEQLPEGVAEKMIEAAGRLMPKKVKK